MREITTEVLRKLFSLRFQLPKGGVHHIRRSSANHAEVLVNVVVVCLQPRGFN